MVRFRFSLESVLSLRQAQMEAEERRLRGLEQELSQIGEAIDRARASRRDAEQHTMAGPLHGTDLAALSAYQRRKTAEENIAIRRREDCQRRLDEQRLRFLEARRQCRLLEKLKQKQHAAWQYQAARELEELAGESYLARWSREKR